MTTQSVSCFKNIMLVVREKSEQDTKKVIDKMEGVNPVHWTSQDFWFHKVFGVVQGEDGADFARGWSMRTEIQLKDVYILMVKKPGLEDGLNMTNETQQI